MNIELYKLEDFEGQKVKQIIKNCDSEILVFKTSFLHKKEQVDNLLFFDCIQKRSRAVCIIIDVDFEKCLASDVFIFDKKQVRKIDVKDCVFGFCLRLDMAKIMFVFGDNIYKSKFKNFALKSDCKNIVHIDLYQEGYVFCDKNFEENLNIISTFCEGKFIIKK